MRRIALTLATSALLLTAVPAPAPAQEKMSDQLRADLEFARRKVYPTLVNIGVVTKWYSGGRVRREGGPVESIHPGDVVWIPPGEKHWHGAAPDTAMTHIAVHEALDGETVQWLEPVSDADYEGRA